MNTLESVVQRNTISTDSRASLRIHQVDKVWERPYRRGRGDSTIGIEDATIEGSAITQSIKEFIVITCKTQSPPINADTVSVVLTLIGCPIGCPSFDSSNTEF